MSTEPVIQLGPYTQGEIPPPLQETFQDENQLAIDITGYAGRFVYQRHRAGAGYPLDARDAVAVTQVAVVNPDQVGGKGQVTYSWVAADFTLDGDFEGEFWIGNGVNRFCSKKYAWHTRTALAIPAI